jgi:type IV secretory pathway VirB2 component (pilin)
MSLQRSLLDAPQGVVIADGVGGVSGLLTGSLAVSLAVIGIALLGFLLLTGRVDIRRSGLVVLGAFILFGTPVLVVGLIELGTGGSASLMIPPVAAEQVEPPREALPPANYDPYAGASLRRD